MTDIHSALIYIMVLASASDGSMSDEELRTFGEMVRFLPVFSGFDPDDLPRITAECGQLLQPEDGLDRTLDTIRDEWTARIEEIADENGWR